MAAKKSERSYGLSAEEIKQLAEEYRATKTFPNPHRMGAYKFAIDGLVALGVNKQHRIAKVHQAFRRAAGEEWYKAWASKEPRNKETGKDVDGRLLQNLQVLQRTKDYGRRLLDTGRRVLRSKGAVIDLTRDSNGEIMVVLNTKSGTPQKVGRIARASPSGERARGTTSKRVKRSKPRRRSKSDPGAEPSSNESVGQQSTPVS